MPSMGKRSLIPFLFGVAVGIIFAWNAEIWITGRGAVSTYVAPFGLAAFFAALFLRSRGGHE